MLYKIHYLRCTRFSWLQTTLFFDDFFRQHSVRFCKSSKLSKFYSDAEGMMDKTYIFVQQIIKNYSQLLFVIQSLYYFIFKKFYGMDGIAKKIIIDKIERVHGWL